MPKIGVLINKIMKTIGTFNTLNSHYFVPVYVNSFNLG